MKNLESFENFKEEQIEPCNLILGGEVISTCWTGDAGGSGKDTYDSDTKKLVYIVIA